MEPMSAGNMALPTDRMPTLEHTSCMQTIIPEAITDATARLASIVIPSNAYLHFAHAYDFEKYSSNSNYYDGGVLEYSNNNGVTWADAGALIDDNGYKGTIYRS